MTPLHSPHNTDLHIHEASSPKPLTVDQQSLVDHSSYILDWLERELRLPKHQRNDQPSVDADYREQCLVRELGPDHPLTMKYIARYRQLVPDVQDDGEELPWKQVG